MSEVVLKVLKVGLKNRSYPIYIGRELSAYINNVSLDYRRNGIDVVNLIDEGLKKKSPHFCDELMKTNPTLLLPSGENTKSVNFLSKTWDFLVSQRVDRSGVLFALGGGVVGDLAGFAAAVLSSGN